MTDLWESLKRIPKEPIRDPAVLKRMEIAFALAEAAEQMKRMTLRRQNPEATEEEIERAIREWYAYRPGAEHGDGDGVPALHRLARVTGNGDD